MGSQNRSSVSLIRILHRATCGTLKDHDDQYQMICGTRDELEQIMEEYDKLCPACL